MEKAFTLTPHQLAVQLDTDLQKGLSAEEAEARLRKYGPNTLKQAKGPSLLAILVDQFKDFLVVILLAASLVSFFLGESIDAVMIMAIVIINASVGFIQEYRVEKAIEHLKKLITTNTKVYRDGTLTEIPSSQLVPGDLVVIEEGEKVPADIRVTSSFSLQAVEAALTGESTPAAKAVEPLTGAVPVADQKNMIFSGTIVSLGKGTGIVVATGMDTQLGKIAHLVSAESSPPTPMQVKLDRLGKFIGKIVLAVAAVVGLEEVVFGNHRLLEALLSGVALAVAAIPEGLPAVVTISLALGTKRLLRQNALLRNLPAAETLGSTDIICCDKTGTLTEGAMQVRKIYLDGQTFEVDKKSLPNRSLEKILKFGYLSSNARQSGNPPGSEARKIIGDPTEAALVRAALEAGFTQDGLDKKYTRVTEVPFSSDRKMMTTVSKDGNGQLVTSKGAVEVILSQCSKIEVNGKVRNLTEADKEEILKVNDEMAQSALRVLAFAYKLAKEKVPEKDIENCLIFLGLAGMMDPPKSGVREAVNTCQKAGIKVVMITGDHLLTAEAVAREIGIAGSSITGVELDTLSDGEFNQKVESIQIYARVNPEHKIRIVKALKAHGYQVAMTGDGVNDAPALKAADIGVAMGINGTDVAKDASDMVLLDDNFSTIVAAVREGRGIYENIRKFVAYLLSANAMEVGAIFVAVILGWPLPLLPVHLLWINLVTDGLPAVALGVDPARANIMDTKPGEFRQQIVSTSLIRLLGFVSVITSAAVLAIFGATKTNLVYAQTMAFTAVVIFEFIVIAAIRAEYNLKFFSNKFLTLAVAASLLLHLLVLYLPLTFGSLTLQSLFKVQSLNLTDWAILASVGTLLYAIMHFTIMRPLSKTVPT